MTYKAIVTELTVRPHPNADRLQLATAFGNQIVVGLDVKTGDRGIFFPTDGQLTPRVLVECDLLPRYNEQGERIGGGYFAENGRVRSQKFRQERSDGFWMPLTQLAWTGANLDSLRVGDTLDTLNGILLCQKYETQATKQAKGDQRQSSRGQTLYFPKHKDTEQFRFFADTIPAGSLITITEKLHGTSLRVGKVLDEQRVRLTGWREWLRKLLKRPVFVTTDYTLLVGSRNVILNRPDAVTYYGGDAFRWQFALPLEAQLYHGETLYGEHVGYTDTGALIMNEHDTIVQDKTFSKTYGKIMRYVYGTSEGETRTYIYRITMTNDQCVVTELSDAQMRKRARELGLQCVPVLAQHIYTGNPDDLRSFVESLTDGSSILDASHIREGVVVRVDAPDGTTTWYKNKAFAFGVMEGYIKERTDAVDREEAS